MFGCAQVQNAIAQLLQMVLNMELCLAADAQRCATRVKRLAQSTQQHKSRLLAVRVEFKRR